MPIVRRASSLSSLLLPAAALMAASACGSGSTDPDPDPDECRFRTPMDEVEAPPIYTPRWAFYPWISKDISDTADTYDFVDGFESRGIPVGVVVIDSPWETHYNTFVPNPKRYPDFDLLVSNLRDRDIRVILWMTQMVNRTGFDLEPDGDIYEGESPNFAEAERCGFFVNDGATYLWWKGFGAGIDFFHPEGVAWWRRQQDPLLDLGVAGWKLDFGEQYLPLEPVKTFVGEVSHQEYSEKYYEDFYVYGASRVGTEEFVTMVRPWDESYGFPGRFFARPEHAPTAWVGDNRRDYLGLLDALDHTFRSAQAGYAVIGSDIGGYLDVDDLDITESIPFDTLVFARWTAVGALSPFMQLHGRANIAPWTVPDNVEETVALYRYWSVLHTELVPFFYSLTREFYETPADDLDRRPPLRPVGAGPLDWDDDWRYQLGEAFLVAPIFDETGVRDVELPSGAAWYDWWVPAGNPIAGGQTLVAYDSTPRDRIPLFVREGAIVPAEVSSSLTGLGNDASAGALTLAIWPGAELSTFRVYEEDGVVTEVGASAAMAAITTVTVSRSRAQTILRIRRDNPTSQVRVNGAAIPEHADRATFDAAESGWLADPAIRSVWVKLGPSGSASVVLEAILEM